ncbi:glycosyltransferase 87 family protein [Streptomyces sp. AM 4-1-1]|uniref:glycosyltransferase family 39 protein n=1 Tax=Streptomyces sp. AM 4-1-1 TaxID=3028710 RepID=UPI0023B89FD6|nr:glycosyltransferase family 39 protein [Streptomyces sp. AM 4-1-1]WEH33722.1 glycosyltransferase 87 family protein [Streptomyces sp. AM 4-1-1]
MGIRMRWDALTVRRARAAVLVAAAIGMVTRMMIAVNTPGPADVRYFQGFAKALTVYGPIRIYEQPLPGLPLYNHPPLAGWLLLGLHELSGAGIPFATLMRVPASLADFLCALLVFEAVRRRGSIRTAAVCGAGVALSPLLTATSGYHGNTDSVAIALVLAAAFLLADRKSPLAAGVAAALGISVKFVPVVAVPALFVVALRGGRSTLTRFTCGFAGVIALLWGPVLATVPEQLKENVLEYGGGGHRLWGLVRFADQLGLPDSFVVFLRGDGHFLPVLICVAAGVWLAWLRPARLTAAVSVTLGLLLLLSTASALQYLTWAAAAMFVLGPWEGVACNAVLGLLASLAYHGRSAVRWSEPLLYLGEFGWLVLAVSLATGVRSLLGARPDTDGGTGPATGAGTDAVTGTATDAATTTATDAATTTATDAATTTATDAAKGAATATGSGTATVTPPRTAEPAPAADRTGPAATAAPADADVPTTPAGPAPAPDRPGPADRAEPSVN